MAWTQIGVTVGGNIKEFQGVAAEPRIIEDIGSGSSVYILDTKKAMVYDSKHINTVTGDGWWEV